MAEQRITIDAGGRLASGRGFQTLADEYAGFAGDLHTKWGEDSPLPYMEFSVPYSMLRQSLLERCDQLGAALGDMGDGQVVMAETNVAAEQASAEAVARVGKVKG